MATYDVSKGQDGQWHVRRTDQTAHIGKLATKAAAIRCARMLAGWSGTVTSKGRVLFEGSLSEAAIAARNARTGV